MWNERRESCCFLFRPSSFRENALHLPLVRYPWFMKKVKGLAEAKPTHPTQPLILSQPTPDIAGWVMRTATCLISGFAGKYNHETEHDKWQHDKNNREIRKIHH